MFKGLCGRLQDVRFVLLTDVKFVNDALVELVEDVAFAADVVDAVAQFVVDRQRLVELLCHLHDNELVDTRWATDS